MKRFLCGVALGVACGAALVGGATARRALAAPVPESPLPAADESASELRRDLTVHITPRMVRYSYTRYALYFASTLVNALALTVLLRCGVSARLRNLAGRTGRNGLARAYIYYPLLTLAYGAPTLPLTLYSSFLLPHQYGLSNQSFGGWMADGAKGFAISSALAPPIIALLYWSLKRSPRRWWLGFWLALIPLLIAAVLLTPLVVEPLFNKFGPLRNAELQERILALAARAGIERGRVFEVDASVRTKGVNAYVTGLGGSARIVLWDTLLQRLNEREVLFVMAHEMGHYQEKHVPLGLTLSILGSLFVLLVTDRGTRWLLARHGDRWQVHHLDDLASLPALMLVLMVVNFLGSPVESAVSRTIESRADQFALRLTHDPEAGASSFIKLSELNLSHPSPPPFVELWMFSHPPLQKRIQATVDWRREHPDLAR
jgi:Zn-dependent protease with chaperone function